MVFAKLAFLNKLKKILISGTFWGPQITEKLVKISMQTCYWNAVWTFIKIWWFSPHFDLQNAPPKSLKYWLLELSRRFVIDLVLQGRIWMDSGWPGLDFSLILDRFWLYFKWSERTFCKQWLDEQYALIAALNIAICCHIGFSRWHLVRRAAHHASAASPTGSARRAEYKSISLTFPTWTWHKFKKKIKNNPQRLNLKLDACWAPPIL